MIRLAVEVSQHVTIIHLTLRPANALTDRQPAWAEGAGWWKSIGEIHDPWWLGDVQVVMNPYESHRNHGRNPDVVCLSRGKRYFRSRGNIKTHKNTMKLMPWNATTSQTVLQVRGSFWLCPWSRESTTCWGPNWWLICLEVILHITT